MSAPPINIAEATSMISYAIECMEMADYPTVHNFPEMKYIATDPNSGSIECSFPNGTMLDIKITFHKADM